MRLDRRERAVLRTSCEMAISIMRIAERSCIPAVEEILSSLQSAGQVQEFIHLSKNELWFVRTCHVLQLL